jgi:hypothetical protein
MASLNTPAGPGLGRPCSTRSLPFAETIDIATAEIADDEPSPCVPSATAVWYELRPLRDGTLVLDLEGSTPQDSVVRAYRRGSRGLEFIGCASPIWNGRLSLEVPVLDGDIVFAQIGTSESHEGRIVIRGELRR